MAPNNQKLGEQLNLALDATQEEREKSITLDEGYLPEIQEWEVIVKYFGDILRLGAELGAQVEILTDEYAILTLPEDVIEELAAREEIVYVEMPNDLGLVLDNSLDAACITQVQIYPPYELKGEGVLLGIIDTGIDYLHPDFRNEDGTTRIVSIWDQTIEGDPPAGFNSGTEYTREQINEALQQPTRAEAMEIVPSMDVMRHGTHVAGIAGGNGRASNGRYTGAAPEAEFVIVKLGRRGDESFPKTTELMRALKYVVEKAEEEGKPIAVNISYGNNTGSHDGSSLFETYIDDWANRWKTSIVVGAGNEGASPIHTNGIIEEGETADIQLLIGAGQPSINIQLWKEYEDDILISLTAPNGVSTGFISPILGTQRFTLGNTRILLYYGKPSPFNRSQMIYIQMIPIQGQFLDEGIWTITLSGESIVSGAFDMWIPITSLLSEDTGFAQPTVETTLTIPSTTNRVITVGSYNPTINQISPFSSRGYTRKSDMVKPDLVAPGEEITAPVPGGGYDTMSGTSMAAPHVTGAAALLMQWGIIQGNDPFLYGDKAKAYLIKGANRDPNVLYPNPTWGYGRLCLENSFPLQRSAEGTLAATQLEPNTSSCEAVILSPDTMEIYVEYEGNIEAVAQEYRAQCYHILDDQYAILYVPLGSIGNCTEGYKEVAYIQIPNLYGPYGEVSLQEAGILDLHNHPYVPLRGQGTLVAIIDSGIDYTNPAFVYENKTTKITRLWDQTIQGAPPDGYLYGTEYTTEEINAALQSENPLEIVPSVDPTGHGTFLAGVSAGLEKEEDSFVGAAPGADLLVVKLREGKQCLRDYFLVNEEAVTYQSTDVLQGVQYCRRVANELGKPLSILIGLGCNEGGHDGSSISEQYLSQVGAQEGNVVTVAAGNEANAAHHYLGMIEEEEDSENFEVIVAEGERGLTLTIWDQAPDKIEISLVSPGGESIDRIPARVTQTQEVQLVLEETRVYIEYQLFEGRTGDQAIFVRLQDPTPGIWTFTIYGELIVNGRFDAWLPRIGWISPDTKFVQPDPYTTVSIPSTSTQTVTVGAYNHINNSLYLASGRGLTRDYELKPDLVAPGVNVIGPVLGGGYGTMTGTSVAAAHVAGASALLLEWGIVRGNDMEMNTQRVNNYLIRGARRRPVIEYPNREWGYGELNLIGSLEVLRG